MKPIPNGSQNVNPRYASVITVADARGTLSVVSDTTITPSTIARPPGVIETIENRFAKL